MPFPPGGGRYGGGTRGGFTPTPLSPIEGEGSCSRNTSINDLPL
jgi:hypothetical protein